ncbi:MAG TPA: hypothetical protein VGL57_01655 [Solirubrobacteraceae bacterium]|jgi:hypothetical protein
MNNVKVTLAVGIALTLAIGAVTLSRSPPRVLRVNGPAANQSLGVTNKEPAICQAREVVPANVSAIRLSIDAFFGSNIHLVAYHENHILTEGRRGPTWTGTSVTVPVRPVDHTTSQVNLCFTLAPNHQLVIIPGYRTPPSRSAVALSSTLTSASAAGTGLHLKGRFLAAYLTAGSGSWWSRIPAVVRHMGFGHFISGIWVALLAAALMLAVGLLTLRLTLQERP